MSAAYDWTCPKCGAPPLRACRTLTTNRVTDTHAARLNRPRIRMWTPCRAGHPDPERCPKCTPPEDERCPEYREDYHYQPGNTPEPPSVTRYPCRVLGEHGFHRDGWGTTWWPADLTTPHAAHLAAQRPTLAPTEES